MAQARWYDTHNEMTCGDCLAERRRGRGGQTTPLRPSRLTVSLAGRPENEA